MNKKVATFAPAFRTNALPETNNPGAWFRRKVETEVLKKSSKKVAKIFGSKAGKMLSLHPLSLLNWGVDRYRKRVL